MSDDGVRCSQEEQAVLDLIDTDELVELTCALVNAAGENPGGTEEDTARVLERAASERGLTARSHVVAPGRAIRYGVAVGKDELVWKGRATVGRKTEWPSWRPTPAMIKRKPQQYGKWADGMPGGPTNPLGARALYLYEAKGNDTSIRIHGTTEPNSIGRAVSNGCLRMRNEAVMDLYEQVPVGTPVYVY